jgi:DNA-binding transcriptional LysR family regulator
MHDINWDNLKYILAVSEAGSLAAASRKLHVDRTTVLRRLNEFEKDLQCRIFERDRTGYALTQEGENLLLAARDIESTVNDLVRQIAGHETRLEGTLRVTTTDSLYYALVSSKLASFQRAHPYINLELAVSNHVLNLSRRDADVAIRPTDSPPSGLVAEKVGEVGYGIYASADYLAASAGELPSQHRWLGVDDPLTSSAAGRWLQEQVPADCFGFRANSFLALRVAAENGMGVTVLPDVLGDDSATLQRIEMQPGLPATDLWLLTHPDLVRSARVHAFVEHFCEALRTATGH